MSIIQSKMKTTTPKAEGQQQDEELDKILSAIREVITSSSPNTDVLELTDKVEDDFAAALSAKHSTAQKKNASEGEIPTSNKATNVVIDMLADLNHKRRAANDENILDPEVIKQSRKVLQDTIRNNQTEPDKKISINITLEDMVTEVLKPYLGDWLNKNLPGIVSNIVQKEIKKIIP